MSSRALLFHVLGRHQHGGVLRQGGGGWSGAGDRGLLGAENGASAPRQPGAGRRHHSARRVPSGAPTCHFTIFRPTEGERAAWESYTRLLEEKALLRSKRSRTPEGT